MPVLMLILAEIGFDAVVFVVMTVFALSSINYFVPPIRYDNLGRIPRSIE
jgi:TRAP-type C4-dicarboxylate transport system permease large subunit